MDAPPVASTSSSSTGRLGLCRSCANAARYTCPACAFPSCSLACSTAHKTATNCTGVAAPVWAQPLQASQMGWGPLMRDQSYISGVSRVAEEIGKKLVGDKLIPKGGRASSDGRLDERTEKEDKLVKDARTDEVDLVLLPKGMSRRSRNGSRWDSKASRMEWTVELVFQPRPSTDRTLPPQQPLTVTTTPQPASATLYTVLHNAFSARDRKGKGKELREEELKWIADECKWLDTFKPDEPATMAHKKDGADGEASEGAVVPPRQPSPSPSAEEEDAEPPFLVLLTVYSVPPPPPPPNDDDEEDEATSSSHPPPPLINSKPPPRKYYMLHPSTILRTALAGATVLEYPTMELWTREAFLRAKLMGKLEIVEKPRTLVPLQSSNSGWERGRGRGRGRGSSTRGGRGGRGGGRGGGDSGGASSGNWRQEEEGQARTQDSGWGKRAGAANVAEDDSTTSTHVDKRPRVEFEIVIDPHGSNNIASFPPSLVNYDSD